MPRLDTPSQPKQPDLTPAQLWERRQSRIKKARRTLICVAACVIASVASLGAIKVAGDLGLNADGLTLVMLLPGLISLALVRNQWRHAYRWLALYGLISFGLVAVNGLETVLLVGNFWLLYVTWAVEKDAPVRTAGLLRRTPRESE